MALVEEQIQKQKAKKKNNVVLDSHGERRLHTTSLVKTEDFPQGEEEDVSGNGKGIKLRRAGTSRRPIYKMRVFSFLAPTAEGIRKSIKYGLSAVNFTRMRRSTFLRPPPEKQRKSSFIPSDDGALDSIADDSFTGSDAGSKVEMGKQRQGNRGSIQLLGNNKVHSSPV